MSLQGNKNGGEKGGKNSPKLNCHTKGIGMV